MVDNVMAHGRRHQDAALQPSGRITSTAPPSDGAQDGTESQLLLADGFHRYHAHKALGASGIMAEVRNGPRGDALRFSLWASAKHSNQCTGRDLARTYETAVRNGLVRPYQGDAAPQPTACVLLVGP